MLLISYIYFIHIRQAVLYLQRSSNSKTWYREKLIKSFTLDLRIEILIIQLLTLSRLFLVYIMVISTVFVASRILICYRLCCVLPFRAFSLARLSTTFTRSKSVFSAYRWILGLRFSPNAFIINNNAPCYGLKRRPAKGVWWPRFGRCSYRQRVKGPVPVARRVWPRGAVKGSGYLRISNARNRCDLAKAVLDFAWVHRN